MNFSEGFKQTNQQCKFSPDGSFLVSKVQISYLLEKGRKLNVYKMLEGVQDVLWASYVYCLYATCPGENQLSSVFRLTIESIVKCLGSFCQLQRTNHFKTEDFHIAT